MACTPLPSADELWQLLDYDPETGILTWRFRPGVPVSWNDMFAGKRAGHPDKLGRVRLAINYKHVRAHRVIFKMVHDQEPALIDHINGNPSDNRITNLRAATVQQNRMNSKGRSQRGLPKGVSVSGGRYTAMIKVNKKSLYLGSFVTATEARAAYNAAAKIHHGEFARTP